MTNYEDEYKYYCSFLNKGFSKSSVRKHNMAMKKLGEMFYKIKDEPQKDFLLRLLHSDDKEVVSMVASHCLGLGVYLYEAQNALLDIAHDKNNPLLAFEAEATLEVWKKQGYLDF